MQTELLSPEYKELLHSELVEVYKSAIEIAKRDSLVLVDFVSISQACKLYSISNNTLTNWLAKGLPAYQIDGKKYLKRSEINKFIEKHEI